MKRALVIVLVSSTLAACSGSDQSELPASPTDSPTSSTPVEESPSPTPTIAEWDYCSNSQAVGHLVRQVRKGVELPDVLIAEAGELRDNITTYSRDLDDAEELGALRDVADAVGKLQLALLDAGPDYPFDEIVALRAQSVSFTGLTAALTLRCEP